MCDQMNTCDPTGLKLVWGNLATCKAASATSCAGGTHPMANGVVDQTACQTAYTTSCDSYFETIAHGNSSCYPKPGSAAMNAACGYDDQCAAGLYCFLGAAASPDPRCMQGMCATDDSTGTTCTNDAGCDVVLGVHCLATATGSPLTSDNQKICQKPVYGASGAACLAGTNKQCQAAFYCGPNNTCIAKLAAGATCKAADNSCDDRTHLACVIPNGGTATACTAPKLVPANSQCGAVAGMQQVQICDGDLYCDTTTTPSTCKPKVAKGTGCVKTIAGECAYGLVCDTGTSTCNDPPAAVCN